MHQHAGLAAAGAGQHQHVLALGGDRVALGVVEGFEYFCDIHVRILAVFASPIH